MLDQFLGLTLVVGQMHALMDGRQIRRRPQLRSDYRHSRTKHDKARQVLIARAEPVREPRAHRWLSGERMATIEHKQGRLVIRSLGVLRTGKAKVFCYLPMLRKDIDYITVPLSVL